MRQTTDTTIRLPRRQDRGFSYIIVLAAIVIVGIMAEVTTTLTSHELRVDREAELLHRGLAYRRAIESYYQAGKVLKRFPPNLEDLAKDPRFPKRHHIRQLYPDPMGKDDNKEWTLVRAADGGIAGVASRGEEEPIKQANFPKKLEKFTGAAAYSEWIFEYVPPPPPPVRVPRAPIPPPLAAPPVLKTN